MPIIDDAFLSTLVREPLAPAVPEEEEKAFSQYFPSSGLS